MKRTLSTKQVAITARVTPRVVQYWVRKGKLVPLNPEVIGRGGKEYLFDSEQVQAFLRQRHEDRARPPEITHGTLSGYTNHGCRCDDCRAAIRAYSAERRRRARQPETGA